MRLTARPAPRSTFIVGTAALAAVGLAAAAPGDIALAVGAANAARAAWQVLAVACAAWVAVFWQQVVFSRRV